jgi:hypothetical protein
MGESSQHSGGVCSLALSVRVFSWLPGNKCSVCPQVAGCSVHPVVLVAQNHDKHHASCSPARGAAKLLRLLCCRAIGAGASLDLFAGSCLTLRRRDGARICASIAPQPAMLHDLVRQGQWDKAVRLARCESASF